MTATTFTTPRMTHRISAEHVQLAHDLLAAGPWSQDHVTKTAPITALQARALVKYRSLTLTEQARLFSYLYYVIGDLPENRQGGAGEVSLLSLIERLQDIRKEKQARANVSSARALAFAQRCGAAVANMSAQLVR